MLVSARAADIDVAAERGSAAQPDGREHPELGKRQVHLGFERVAVLPHDVGDVEVRPPGGCRTGGHADFSPSGASAPAGSASW